jgi:hypothetical protein
MTKTILSICVVVASVLAMTSASLAADKWLATWKLNVSKSTFNPGPAPRGQTVRFEAVDGGFRLTTDTLDAEGKSSQGSYTARFDGKDHPWNNNANADMVAIKRIDDSTYESTWKKAGQVAITSKVVVSPDGKVLTNTQTGKNAQNQSVNHTLVFERQ